MGPMWMLYLGINLIGVGGFLMYRSYEQYRKHKEKMKNAL